MRRHITTACKATRDVGGAGGRDEQAVLPRIGALEDTMRDLMVELRGIRAQNAKVEFLMTHIEILAGGFAG